MRAVRLWKGNLEWSRLFRAGEILVVHDEYSDPKGSFPTRSFDLRSREPLGPTFGTGETICVADIPERWHRPVVAYAEPGSLVVSDPRDGALLERIPLPQLKGRSPDDLVLARVEGRNLLYLLEGGGYNNCSWSTVDLDSPEPVVDLCDSFMLYNMARERMALDGEWLAVPAEKYVDFFYDDPEIFPEIIAEPRVRVYRASDGDLLGQIDADGGEAVVAAVGGRSYLAQDQCVHSLPDLTPVVRLGWSTGVALAEWEGRPVAVFAREREDVPHVVGRSRPVRLVHCFLDGHVEEGRSAPVFTEIPWEVPGEFHDLLATPEREVVVATSEGVYAVTVDP